MKFRFLFAFRLFPSKLVDHYSDGSVACHVTSRSKRVKSDVESYHQCLLFAVKFQDAG